MVNDFIVKNITNKNILLSDIPNTPLLLPNQIYNLSGFDFEDSRDLEYALSKNWLEKIENKEKISEEINEETNEQEEIYDNLEETLKNFSRKEILDIVKPTLSESINLTGVHNVEDLDDEQEELNQDLEEYKEIWVTHQELNEKLEEIKEMAKKNNIIVFNQINQLFAKIDKINPEKEILIKKLSQLEYDKENLNQQLKEKKEEIEDISNKIKLKDFQ